MPDVSTLSWSEPTARLAAFISVFVLMAALELAWPRRRLGWSKAKRWVTNLSIVGLGAALVRVFSAIAALTAVPIVATLAAAWAEARGIGLLNMVAWPAGLEVLFAVVILDFAIWLQHLLAHRIELLWLFHRMHHADVDFDVTTALRFHPVEIGLSMLYKVVWVVALGASPLAVLIFEVVLNALAMFNHANFALPLPIDRMMRGLIVTPDMHRVHHSISPREHHSNFGFNLSVWDRLFGTYNAQPAAGHEAMTIGLPPWQSEAPTGLGWSLKLPFTGPAPDHKVRAMSARRD
ncbi:MAG TPA: sterol desaturase family protein [Hyphomicrobiaceae bacterium]|nr:sterol desaturase family protein [Hyphomicrobiaceae bacterium]